MNHPSGKTAIVVAMLFARASICLAVAIEEFETTAPTWRMAYADCPARVVVQQRVFDQAQRGRGCELIQLQTGSGTTVHLAHAVPPAPVIAELAPSLWLKADRAGPRLLARVVLPRSTDPKTGKTVTVLIEGDSYDRPGAWQQLRLRDAKLLLERQVRVTRAAIGPNVDPAEAYIDMVVVNAFSGPGRTNLYFDDLELDGYVDVGLARSAVGLPSPTSPVGDAELPTDADKAEVQASIPPPALNGTTFLVAGKPFFPRIIRHQGEPLAFLRELGFNTVALRAPPTMDQLSEAERTDLWLIAPPPVPPHHDLPASDALAGRYRRVIAWVVEATPDWSASVTEANAISRIRQADPIDGRPVVALAAAGDARTWTGIADLVALSVVLHMSTDQPGAVGRTLSRDAAQLPPRAAFWASIPADFPVAIAEQISLLDGRRPRIPAAEFSQLRLAVLEAFAVGARGLMLDSRSRLDAEDDDARLRAASFRLINRELDWIEPWGAGGTANGEIAADDRLVARQLETERSRLVIATAGGHDHPSTRSDFSISGLPVADQVFRLLPSGLEPISVTVTGARTVPLPTPESPVLCLSTPDPLVLAHVTRAMQRTRREIASLQREVSRLELQRVRAVDAQLVQLQQRLPEADRLLRDADARWRQAEQFHTSGDEPHAAQSRTALLVSLRQLRETQRGHAVRLFPTRSASPLCLSYYTLPLHWELARRLGARGWSGNALSGGGFENLAELTSNGWEQERIGDSTATMVELSPDAPAQGRFALRLVATQAGIAANGDARAAWPIVIRSAPVPVRQGQVVRVTGQMRVAGRTRGAEAAGPDAGELWVWENFGGLDLAERVRVTDGWQAFTWYRAAPGNEPLRIAIAVSGPIEASLDDLAVSVLQ